MDTGGNVRVGSSVTAVALTNSEQLHLQEQLFQQMATCVSSVHVQKTSTINYHNVLKSPSDSPQLNTDFMTPHFTDFVGPHFMVVDKSSITKLALGRLPVLTGMLITYWPTELLKNSDVLPPWWLKAVATIKNLVLRFSNVPVNAKILEALLTNSPQLTNLTLEVDLFSQDLFPSCNDKQQASRRTKLTRAFANIKCLTIINLRCFFGLRTLTSNFTSKHWNNNVMKLQQWTSGSLVALSIRNSEDGHCLLDSSFNEDCVLPFILNNLTTLKYLDLYNTILQAKHLKRIIRHKDFKKLKLTSLIIDVRFDVIMCTQPEDLDNTIFKTFDSNFPDALRILKSQSTLTALFIRMDAWDRPGIMKILRCVPHLETICFDQLEIKLEGMSSSSSTSRIDVNSIFSVFPTSLKVIKLMCELPTPLLDPTQLRDMQVFRAISVEPNFFQNLPSGLLSFCATNMFFTSSACFDSIITQCPNMTSLSLKTNEDMLGNDGFRKIVRGFKMLKYLEINESIVSNAGLMDDSVPDKSDANQNQKVDEESRPCILNSLEFLEELKLIFFPYLTSNGFKSIKHPNLKRIDVSQNKGVTEDVIVELISNNPCLEHISVNRCPHILMPSVMELIKVGVKTGRELSFEVDTSYTNMTSGLKTATSETNKETVFAMDELNRLLQFYTHSIPTHIEYTKGEKNDEEGQNTYGFHEILKRMRIKDDTLGETLIGTLTEPEVRRVTSSDEMFNRQMAKKFSQIFKTFFQSPNLPVLVNEKEVARQTTARPPSRKMPKMGYQYPIPMDSSEDEVVREPTPETEFQFDDKDFSETTVPASTPEVQHFSAAEAKFQVQLHYNWASPWYNPIPSSKPKAGKPLRNKERSKTI